MDINESGYVASFDGSSNHDERRHTESNL